MRIVTDTSVFLAVVLDEPEKKKLIMLTAGHELIAPEILPFEIGNALSALVKRKRLSPEEALAAWRVSSMIPVELRSIDIERALNIAIANNIYAYDAYFIACALNFNCPLLTLDKQLRSISANLGINTLETVQ